MFYWEFLKIFKNICFPEHLRKAVSEWWWELLAMQRFNFSFSYMKSRYNPSRNLWFLKMFLQSILTFYFFSYRSIHWRSSVKKGVLKTFAIFTRKHLCCSLFLKRYSNTGVFLWMFFLWRTSANALLPLPQKFSPRKFYCSV